MTGHRCCDVGRAVMFSVKQVLDAAGSRLAAFADEPYADVRALAGHVLQRHRAWLIAHSDDEFPVDILDEFWHLIDGRVQGRPVAHLTGYREFWGVRLKVTPATLIPRPETEHLVEQTLLLDLPEESSILDFGTGSGAIAIALACERPAWNIHAMDISGAALQVAVENAALARVPNILFRCSDSLAAYGFHGFDAIISNPPYVAEGDPHLLCGDVRFDPANALMSGEDGLNCIRYLITDAPKFLKPNGWLLMEHGHDQSRSVRVLLEQAGYGDIRTALDLAGNDRVIWARCPDSG